MEILVSIWCAVYNHENFLRETLNSFVSQKTSFCFEIIVHDDASTDASRIIIEEYSEKYPDLFICIFQSENQYNKTTLIPFFWEKTHGKYIALCDGDDYWMDPLKLQKQVDFLEQNHEYSILATGTRVIAENANQLSVYSRDQKDFFFEDLIRENILGHSTCSVVFRSNCLRSNKIETLSNAPFGDWSLWLICLSRGKGYFMPEVTACYRQHSNGIWSSLNKETKVKKILQMYDYMIKNYPERRKEILSNRNKYKSKALKGNKDKIFLQSKKIWNKIRHIINKIVSK